jgi:hypothetical protein
MRMELLPGCDVMAASKWLANPQHDGHLPSRSESSNTPAPKTPTPNTPTTPASNKPASNTPASKTPASNTPTFNTPTPGLPESSIAESYIVRDLQRCACWADTAVCLVNTASDPDPDLFHATMKHGLDKLCHNHLHRFAHFIGLLTNFDRGELIKRINTMAS